MSSENATKEFMTTFTEEGFSMKRLEESRKAKLRLKGVSLFAYPDGWTQKCKSKGFNEYYGHLIDYYGNSRIPRIGYKLAVMEFYNKHENVAEIYEVVKVEKVYCLEYVRGAYLESVTV